VVFGDNGIKFRLLTKEMWGAGADLRFGSIVGYMESRAGARRNCWPMVSPWGRQALTAE